jgi:hypothetical protein
MSSQICIICRRVTKAHAELENPFHFSSHHQDININNAEIITINGEIGERRGTGRDEVQSWDQGRIR